MRIVINKNGKLFVQELEEETPTNLRSKIKSFQSSSYSKLPIIYSNEELLKKYSNKRKNNIFINSLLLQRELSSKRSSNSLIDKKALEQFFTRDDSKINRNELKKAKKINLTHNKLNISHVLLDKYDVFDENYKNKLKEFSNFLDKNSKKDEEKEQLNNNAEIKSGNASKTLNNTNNNFNNSPRDSNNNNNSSMFSLNRIKKINIGDILTKKNVFGLKYRLSKFNKGSNDVRVPLNKENPRSYNFRSKYEFKQATQDDMDLILNYGIHTDKSSIIKYFQQNKKISPHYISNLLKYDETQLFKLNKICDVILEKKEIEKNKKRKRYFDMDDKYKNGNLREIEKIMKRSDSVINDYIIADKQRKYWKIRVNKEEAERIKDKYWERYNVNRFLKNKQKLELNKLKTLSLTTKNFDSKKLFSSQSSPNILK